MLYRSRTPHKGPVVLLSGRLGFFRRFVGPIWFLRLFLRMGREGFGALGFSFGRALTPSELPSVWTDSFS